MYYRGDYYRGDYYRGDPGLFSFLGKAAKAVTGVVSKLGIPGISGAAGLVSAAIPTFRKTVPGPVSAPGGGLMIAPTFPQENGQPVGTMLPGGQGFIPGLCNVKGTHVNKSSYYRAVPGQPMTGVLIPKGSVCVSNRRMNVANGRALTRAVRRTRAFVKVYRKAVSALGMTVQRRGSTKKGKR